jgi:TatD DNase family protein
MRFIDTHAHVNFRQFSDDADEVIRRALEGDVWVINVGAEYKSSMRAIDCANKYQRGVYAAIGLHPIHLHEVAAMDDDYDFKTRGEEFNLFEYEKLAQFDKVVAIGEIGLDYFHLPPIDPQKAKRKQQEVFIEQLSLARRLELPVIIHSRDAHDDMLGILKELKKAQVLPVKSEKPWGVMHCFTGNEDLAWEYFNLGLLISFTGVITFSNQWNAMLRKLPLDRIMIETDCPFMTPVPHRGKRNEPILVKHVADYIAQIKGISIEQVAEATTKNAESLFGIGKNN